MNLSQSGTPDAAFRQSTSFCRLSFFCSILLPYIPFSMRQPLLLFTKFLELKECMSCSRQLFDFGSKEPPDAADAISDIAAKLSPFLDEQERSQLSQMQNMMQMLKLYQTFQEFAPFMNMGGDAPDAATDFNGLRSQDGSAAAESNFSGSGRGSDEDSAPEPSEFSGHSNSSGQGNAQTSGGASENGMTNMLFSMLSPEQKEMFENLKSVMTENPAE